LLEQYNVKIESENFKFLNFFVNINAEERDGERSNQLLTFFLSQKTSRSPSPSKEQG